MIYESDFENSKVRPLCLDVGIVTSRKPWMLWNKYDVRFISRFLISDLYRKGTTFGKTQGYNRTYGLGREDRV